MATLVLFSTITQDVLAQRSATASMTVRATVVEAGSIEMISENTFSRPSLDASGFAGGFSSFSGGFELRGTSLSDVMISVTAPESLYNQDGSRVLFTPRVTVGDRSYSETNFLGSVQLKANQGGYQGRGSVWIEGTLQSDNGSVPSGNFTGNYMISAVYN